MALNLKTLLFPDTDFRSAYSQPAQIAPEVGVPVYRSGALSRLVSESGICGRCESRTQNSRDEDRGPEQYPGGFALFLEGRRQRFATKALEPGASWWSLKPVNGHRFRPV